MIQGTDESVTRVGVSIPLMHHDLRDLGTLILIQITPKGMHSTANYALLNNANESGHSQLSP